MDSYSRAIDHLVCGRRVGLGLPKNPTPKIIQRRFDNLELAVLYQMRHEQRPPKAVFDYLRRRCIRAKVDAIIRIKPKLTGSGMLAEY